MTYKLLPEHMSTVIPLEGSNIAHTNSSSTYEQGLMHVFALSFTRSH